MTSDELPSPYAVDDGAASRKLTETSKYGLFSGVYTHEKRHFWPPTQPQRAHLGSRLPRMKLTPSIQIAHLDGIWIETSCSPIHAFL